MKISKERLKQLIAEELSVSFGTHEPEYGEEEHEEKESHDSDGRMAKQNLWKMAEYAKELYNLIDDDEDLEPWVEEKIAIASFMMDSVGHYMQYEKNADHADSSMSHDNIDDEYEDEDEDEEDMEVDIFDDEDGENYEDESEDFEDSDEDEEI